MDTKYLFESERLGFRNWNINDLDEFTKMNSDPLVMEHFPKTFTREETLRGLKRYQKHFEEKEFTYFATEIKATNKFIGFIGLFSQNYESPFTPAVDIGWRLITSAWGKGFATEGAKRCLQYAFGELGIDTIVSVCTLANSNSENVMKKIGMYRKGTFSHPKLKEYPAYEKCVWYEIKKNNE